MVCVTLVLKRESDIIFYIKFSIPRVFSNNMVVFVKVLKDFSFLKQDVPDGFYAVPLLESVYGDNATIECKAHSRAFAAPRFFKLENNEEKEVIAGSEYLLDLKRLDL